MSGKEEQSLVGSLSVIKPLSEMKDNSLELFLRRMAQFDSEFCRLVASNNEFTVRLEIKGDKGRVVHTRVYCDEIERPNSRSK